MQSRESAVSAWQGPMKVLPSEIDGHLKAKPALSLGLDGLSVGISTWSTALASEDISGSTTVTALSSGEASYTNLDPSVLLPVANSIADLQELLQTPEHCTHFRCPPGVSILHWSYTLQRKDNRALHRAVVSFLHDGVPKHVAGERCFSKKVARQSAADLALALLHGCGKPLAEAEHGCIYTEVADLMPCSGKGVRPGTVHVQQLERFCQEQFCSSQLEWQCEVEGEKAFSAYLRLPLLGIMHTFHGPTQASAEVACGELARRVMWCLGCRAVQGKYQPDPQMLLGANCKVSPAAESWTDALTALA